LRLTPLIRLRPDRNIDRGNHALTVKSKHKREIESKKRAEDKKPSFFRF
jgi:hypothetical protein